MQQLCSIPDTALSAIVSSALVDLELPRKHRNSSYSLLPWNATTISSWNGADLLAWLSAKIISWAAIGSARNWLARSNRSFSAISYGFKGLPLVLGVRILCLVL